MNICKCLLVFLFVFPSLPIVSSAQPEIGRQRNLISVSEARNKALTNTVLPVITGVVVPQVFKSKTVQTISASLAIYGLVMGPSAGNFYAEDYLRGGLGAAARLSSGYFLLLDATREIMGKQVSESLGWDDKDVQLTDTGVLIGAGVFIGSMIYNVLSSKASVREYNRSGGYSFRLSGEQVGENTVPVVAAKLSF